MKIRILIKKIKKIKYIIMPILIVFNFTYASSISFMIKKDESTESYLKIKNKGDPVYLMLYCNNFINDVEISIGGVNPSNFMEKNLYKSKVSFLKDFSKEDWIVNYDKNGIMDLKLKNGGINFTKKIYKNNQVLIDIKELKEIKLFEIDNQKRLRDKLNLIFENCGIYI